MGVNGRRIELRTVLGFCYVSSPNRSATLLHSYHPFFHYPFHDASQILVIIVQVLSILHAMVHG